MDDELDGGLLGAAAAEWVASRWVEIGEQRIRYREAGRGLPIVLVHGLGVSSDYWVRNGPVLAASGYRVLAPDLPGFGWSPGPRTGLTVPAQAEAICRWARALDLPPAVYLGHSLSCQSVLELAVRHPAAVRGLVLAAPTGQGGKRRRLVHQALGLLRDFWREPIRLVPLVAQAYLRAGPRRLLRTWWVGADHDPLPLLPHVQVPVLVIRGERDPVVDLDFAQLLVARVAHGRLALIPDGAHGVIFDETGAFNQAILDFLEPSRRMSADPTE